MDAEPARPPLSDDRKGDRVVSSWIRETPYRATRLVVNSVSVNAEETSNHPIFRANKPNRPRTLDGGSVPRSFVFRAIEANSATPEESAVFGLKALHDEALHQHIRPTPLDGLTDFLTREANFRQPVRKKIEGFGGGIPRERSRSGRRLPRQTWRPGRISGGTPPGWRKA